MAFARNNPHLFTTTRAGKAEIDQELNIQTVWVNTLDQRIDDVESQGIAGTTDPANIGKLPVTNGEVIQWVKLNLDYFQPNSLNGTVFEDASIPQRALGNVCVGTPQLIDLSITHQKLALGAVANVNIANGAVTLPKMYSTGHSCFIIGDDANYAYKELPVAANYYVPTRIANATLPSMQPISAVWNNSADNLCSGVKLTNQTVNLTKLVTDAVGGFLISGAGNAAVEILPVLDTDYWKLPVRTSASGGKVTLKGLVEICANYANSIDGGCLRVNTVDGSKVTDGSLPKTKLQNSGQVAPFAMGYVAANGSAQKVLNCTSSRLSLGRYKINLSTAAPDNKYIVVFGNGDNGGNYVTNCFLVDSTRNTGSFEIQVWGSGQAAQDEGFNFVVYAF